MDSFLIAYRAHCVVHCEIRLYVDHRLRLRTDFSCMAMCPIPLDRFERLSKH